MLEEATVVGDGSSDAGLLQHNFGEPDAVRIFAAAPWQVSLELAEPGEKVFAEARQFASREHARSSVAQEAVVLELKWGGTILGA